jgi:hypothetical protein
VEDGGQPLVVPYGGASPVVRDLDGDERKDLLTGAVLGELLVYFNAGTDAAPVFDGAEPVYADGEPAVMLFFRPRPELCDWDGDPYIDLLVGGGDGQICLMRGREPGNAAPDSPAGSVRLLPPWPHPARPGVALSFALPAPGPARLAVFDAAGRRVASLGQDSYPAGLQRVVWDGRDAQGRPLPSGVYLLRLEAGGRCDRQKLVLLR